LRSVRALGTASPLRARLEDGAELLSGDEPVVDLGLVTNLTTFDVGAIAPEYDIPVEMQPTVAQYIQFFQGPGRKWFRKWMSRSTRYIPMMTPLLERSGLPRDTVYLAMIESGFSPGATSWARAAGPWQFIGSTGRRFGLHQDFWIEERRDPLKATVAAGKYLSELHGALGHWYLAWAGYNAGGEKLRRMVQKRGTADFWALSDGKGLANETKHYVPKLIACALVAKHPRAFGFSEDEFDYQQPLQWDEVPVVEPTDLEVIARAAGTSTEEIRELNPELRRWCTPPATAPPPHLVPPPPPPPRPPLPGPDSPREPGGVPRQPGQDRASRAAHLPDPPGAQGRHALPHRGPVPLRCGSHPPVQPAAERADAAAQQRAGGAGGLRSRGDGRGGPRARPTGGSGPRPGLRGPRSRGGSPGGDPPPAEHRSGPGADQERDHRRQDPRPVRGAERGLAVDHRPALCGLGGGAQGLEQPRAEVATRAPGGHRAHRVAGSGRGARGGEGAGGGAGGSAGLARSAGLGDQARSHPPGPVRPAPQHPPARRG